MVMTLPPSRDRPVHSMVSVTSRRWPGFDDRIQVDAPEHDAGIDRGRAQREIDLLAAVQAHAGGADHVLEGAAGAASRDQTTCAVNNTGIGKRRAGPARRSNRLTRGG
jgi:hypothetical protein